MSKISLLTILWLMVYVGASNATSECNAYDVSPCNQHAKDLAVEFATVTVSGCQGYHSKTLFENPPISVQVNFTSSDNKKYTLVMADPDAPNHNKTHVWLHWIISNIPGGSLKASLDVSNWSPTLKNYFPPTPPDHDHRYFFLLYTEEDSNGMDLKDVGKRAKFDLESFKENQSLCGPVVMSSFVTKP